MPLLLPTDPLRSKPVRLALTLGLRPLGEERDLLPHAFALLRGLAIDAILSKYWHLMASSASAAPPPFLLPLEIASVYSSIQSALSAALRHAMNSAGLRAITLRSYSPLAVTLALTTTLSSSSSNSGSSLGSATTRDTSVCSNPPVLSPIAPMHCSRSAAPPFTVGVAPLRVLGP